VSKQKAKERNAGDVIKVIAEISAIISGVAGFVYTYFYSRDTTEES
jgi:hypothetical protein